MGSTDTLTAFNDNLEVGGTIHVNTGPSQGYHAVVIEDTAGNRLGTVQLPGLSTSRNHDLTALNNAGDFVASGTGVSWNTEPVSFVGYDSQLTAIRFPGVRFQSSNNTFPTRVFGLNNAGLIAGQWSVVPRVTGPSTIFGFIHQMDGTAYPSVSCEGVEWDASRSHMQPVAINDQGQVAGYIGTSPTGTFLSPHQRAPCRRSICRMTRGHSQPRRSARPPVTE